MTDVYTNNFYDQLIIEGAEGGGYVVFNRTLQSTETDPFETYEEVTTHLDSVGAQPLELPKDGSLVYNKKFQAMVIDGTNEDDMMEADCETAPFYVFNIALQENASGPFDTKEAAKKAMAELAAQ